MFYLDQPVSTPDMDDLDYTATHFAIFRKGHVIAYARLIINAADEATVSRLLTLEEDYDEYILQQIVFFAQKQGITTLTRA